MNNNENIKDICKEYDIINYTINPDGSIDVNGSVYLSYKNLTKLPLNFNKVTGDFYCRDNKLTTLLGSPQSVGRNFYCSYNNLTSLEGCPKSVSGNFNLHGNPIYNQLGDIDYKSYIKQLNRDKILNELIIMNSNFK